MNSLSHLFDVVPQNFHWFWTLRRFTIGASEAGMVDDQRWICFVNCVEQVHECVVHLNVLKVSKKDVFLVQYADLKDLPAISHHSRATADGGQ